MPHRTENYGPSHPPLDDHTKVAMLWDERHDCDEALAESFKRLRTLEDRVTKLDVIRETGAKLTAAISSLATGLIVAIFVWALKYFG